MSDHLKALFNEIRRDERVKVGKTLVALYKRSVKLCADADQLCIDLQKAAGIGAMTDVAPPAKAKRKPVTVTDAQKDAIATRLDSSPQRIVEIAKTVAVSSKLAGEALRQLVAEGKASRTTNGKFRAVEQPAADGAEE
jgi:hypothetical protein